MPKLNYDYLKKKPEQAEPQADQAEPTPQIDIDAIKKGGITCINLPGTGGAFICSYRDGNRKTFAVAYSPEGKILSIGV